MNSSFVEAFAKSVVILNEVEESPSKTCKRILEIIRQAHNDKFEAFTKASCINLPVLQ